MNKDFFSGLFWFLLAVYFSVEAYRLGLGQLSMPGPGFFPFAAAVIFGIISASVFINSILKAPAEKEFKAVPGRLQYRNIFLILVAMFAYILLLKFLGFVICTFLFVVFLVRGVARQEWKRSLIISFFVTLGCHLVFNILLNAQLPSATVFSIRK